ncbi:hypothetical protein SAV14893_054090 [Streptomyces avermitilis]|uniref:Uncharacterized protein n=1 Tax=Streptomyces avermitilis TaxID=33903 RepID=A0A4D4M2F4_STRAX|nr:hypothetical protein SAV14893_054090 [Streptomyces avermitilis]
MLRILVLRRVGPTGGGRGDQHGDDTGDGECPGTPDTCGTSGRTGAHCASHEDLPLKTGPSGALRPYEPAASEGIRAAPGSEVGKTPGVRARVSRGVPARVFRAVLPAAFPGIPAALRRYGFRYGFAGHAPGQCRLSTRPGRVAQG